MTGIIYIHKNKINGKCYVGQTIRLNPKNRWRGGKSYLTTDTKFSRAIRKYGWYNFDHIVLPTKYSTKKSLDLAEINMIQELDSFNNGYNSTIGGTGSGIMSKETKYKISQSHIGLKHSKETVNKMSKSRKNISIETKKKMSISASNREKKQHVLDRELLKEKRKASMEIITYDILTDTYNKYSSAGVFAKEIKCHRDTVYNAIEKQCTIFKRYNITKVIS